MRSASSTARRSTTVSRRLLALLLLLSGAALAQPVPLDEKSFTGYVIERLRKSAPKLTFRAAETLGVDAVTAEGKVIGRLGLERIWQFCTRNAERCEGAVAKYVEGMAEVLADQTRPVERAQVRLVVRPEDYIAQARRQMAEGKVELIARPLVANLWMVPVVDSPSSMRLVTKDDLAALKLDEEAIFELGRRNLREKSKPLRQVAPVPPRGEIGRLGEDDYESSRLILHGEWADLAARMNNQLVVMVPASNLLIYGDGATAANLDALRALGREAARGSPRPLSIVMLRWTVAGWEIVH